MKIAIVNTGRFGDIIQSAPLIFGLKEKFPNCKIFYICLENFRPAAELIPEIDFIVPFSFHKILKQIDNNNLKESFNLLKNIFYRLKEKFDILINLSFSNLSAIISGILNAKDKKGLILSENNELIIPDNWSKFFLSIVDYREYCPFNIVDIFSKIGGVLSKKIEINSPKKIKNIAFQLGASTENRRWPVKYFSLLAKLILDQHKDINIYLFGAESEIKLGEEFEKFFTSEKIINLIGKTSLKELKNILHKKIDILVSNDTGTMHLAWLCGKKVIELSLGPALYNTTSPFGEEHYIIQPDISCSPCSYQVKCLHLKCHHFIKPQHVYNLIFNNFVFSGNVKIFKTFFDEKGYLSYKKIYGNEDILYKNREKVKKIWINIIENKVFDIKEEKNLVELNEIINKILNFLEKILIEKNSRKRLLYWDKISELENILKNSILTDYNYFLPFYKYFEFLKNYTSNCGYDNVLENYKMALYGLKYAINNFG